MTKLVLALSLCLSTVFSSAYADVIKLGTDQQFAPFEYIDKDGSVKGFDIDLVREILKREGDSIEVSPMPFDGLIPALLTGQIDAIAAGMAITDERKKKVLFTDGYYKSTLSAIILKSNKDKYKSLDDLKGSKICVQLGTTSQEFAKKFTDKVVALNSQTDSMLELQNAGCSAIINDRPVNLYYVNKSKSDVFYELKDERLYENADYFGIAVKKGNTSLLEKLNRGFLKVKEDGTLKDLNLKWFGTE